MTTDLFLQLGSDTYVKMKLFFKKIKKTYFWNGKNIIYSQISMYKTLDKHETPPIEPLSVYTAALTIFQTGYASNQLKPQMCGLV